MSRDIRKNRRAEKAQQRLAAQSKKPRWRWTYTSKAMNRTLSFYENGYDGVVAYSLDDAKEAVAEHLYDESYLTLDDERTEHIEGNGWEELPSEKVIRFYENEMPGWEPGLDDDGMETEPDRIEITVLDALLIYTEGLIYSKE